MVWIVGNQSLSHAAKQCFKVEAADIMILYALNLSIFPSGAWAISRDDPQRTQKLEIGTSVDILEPDVC
jgi:hypothetical protein